MKVYVLIITILYLFKVLRQIVTDQEKMKKDATWFFAGLIITCAAILGVIFQAYSL